MIALSMQLSKYNAIILFFNIF